MSLHYAIEPDLAPAEFVDVLRRSTLAERHADLIVTARDDAGLLVGVSRAITDRHYCTYLSDLAVDVACQRRGIGKELIRRTHAAAGLQTSLILLAAPAARDYYGHIGMQKNDACWFIPRRVQA
jgi:predicted N-acetyltransferase YhbS